MFRKLTSKLKKKHILYLLVTTVLGITLYCALCLHSSPTCHLSFLNINRHCYNKLSTSFPWHCFTESNHVANAAQFGKQLFRKLSGTQITTGDIRMIHIKNVSSTSPMNDSISHGERVPYKSEDEFGISLRKYWPSNRIIQNRSILKRTKFNLHQMSLKPNKNMMNVTDHSCKPLYPRVVLYNRIFKTASTTMSQFLTKCSRRLNFELTKEATEEWSNEKRSHPILRRIQARIKRSKRKHHLAIAHFYFRTDSNLSTTHTYINLMREPVERFISHYHYVRSPNRWPERLRRLKALGHWNVTLAECLERQYEGCKWNTMTRFFCGPEAFCLNGSEVALSRAKSNMLHYYSSVGIMDHLREFIQVLNIRLPEFVTKSPKILEKKFVTSGVKKKPIGKNLLKRIVEVNHADIELYDYAKKLFLRQAEKCGIKVKT